MLYFFGTMCYTVIEVGINNLSVEEKMATEEQIKGLVREIKTHLEDILYGVENGGSAEFFKNESEMIVDLIKQITL